MKFKILAITFVFLAISACKGMEDLDLPPLMPELMHDPDYQALLENAGRQKPIHERSPQELLAILQNLERIQQWQEQFQERQTNAHTTKQSRIIYTCLKCFKSDFNSYPDATGHLRSYHGISRKEFLENKRKYMESKKVFKGINP